MRKNKILDSMMLKNGGGADYRSETELCSDTGGALPAGKIFTEKIDAVSKSFSLQTTFLVHRPG